MAHRSKAHERPKVLPVQTKMPQRPDASSGIPANIDSDVALRAAQSHCTILITGETGVGKGFLARWIHQNSPRHAGPFIPINCGAIPDTLIDSQLFGHVKGAFSGASHDHLGLVRAANHGSLLLDEISELPLSAQNRLLRLLQDREVQPVGHSQPIVVDVRILAATNVDLKQAVVERRFREDLLFRLDVITLQVPPLRQRSHEIPILIERFNCEIADLYHQPALQIEPAALDILAKYAWPGNIRQLRSLIERLHVLCPGQLIAAEDVVEIGQLHHTPSDSNPFAALDEMKQNQLRQVLERSGGSIAKAAEAFGVHRSTIYRWLRGF